VPAPFSNGFVLRPCAVIAADQNSDDSKGERQSAKAFACSHPAIISRHGCQARKIESSPLPGFHAKTQRRRKGRKEGTRGIRNFAGILLCARREDERLHPLDRFRWALRSRIFAKASGPSTNSPRSACSAPTAISRRNSARRNCFTSSRSLQPLLQEVGNEFIKLSLIHI